MFNGEESSTASISASIIQGSVIGPATYTVTAADLKPLQPGNSLVNFADDTYLVVPSVNASTRQQEMDSIATGAAANNLKQKQRNRISEFQKHCHNHCPIYRVKKC